MHLAKESQTCELKQIKKSWQVECLQVVIDTAKNERANLTGDNAIWKVAGCSVCFVHNQAHHIFNWTSACPINRLLVSVTYQTTIRVQNLHLITHVKRKNRDNNSED